MALIVIVAIAAAGVTYIAFRPTPTPSPTPPPTPPVLQPEDIKFGAPFTTPIEEPWDGVIHEAFQWAESEYGLSYDWTDDVGYADLPAVLADWAEEYDIVFGDVFGCEESARTVASDFPDTLFVFGSGLGPVEPNVCVFDDWIHEPAYLCGMIAGKLTDSNILGVVGGVPIPEVNRLVNAFIAGALETNPNVKVKVTFIGEWFNPPVAKEKALAQIAAGADVLYCERYGVHDAALEKLQTEGKVIALFGNLLDQYDMATELVVTGPMWDMKPTVEYVMENYIDRNGDPFAMDLAEWSMAAKGGAKLAPWHDWETRLHEDIVAKMQAEDIVDVIEARWQQILAGAFRVDINESVPVSD